MNENRQYPRLDKSMIVSYRVRNDIFGSGSRLKNISGGGICVPLSQGLEPGVILELEIKVNEEKAVKCIGQIMWRKRTDDQANPFETGVKFIEIKPSDKMKLTEYVNAENAFIEKSKGNSAKK